MDFSRANFEQLLAENAPFHAENRLLKENVQHLLNKLFGPSSEKLSSDQMELAVGELRELQDALDEVEEKSEEAEVEVNSRRGNPCA